MIDNPHTCLEIDLSALTHNYRLLRSILPRQTRFMGVVKANAYGSDSPAIALKLQELGADYLAVAFTAEGGYLREHGIRLPIMVLHPQPSDLDHLIRHHLEPSLYSKRLESFAEAVKTQGGKEYPIHLEFNTGLNRLGFRESDLDWIKGALAKKKCLQLRSIFSHLAASDDLDQKAFTLGQLEAFGILFVPFFERIFMWGLMIVILIWRPRGLFGERKE